MSAVGLAGLVKIDAGATQIRLCEGGVFDYDSERYRTKDDVYGVIGSVTSPADDDSGLFPMIELSLIPAAATSMATLRDKTLKNAIASFIIIEYDLMTHATLSAEILHVGQVTASRVPQKKGQRVLVLTVGSQIEVMIRVNSGNTLTDVFHQSMFSGELGHANANDLQKPVAWGVAGPQRGVTYGGGGSGRREPGIRVDYL